jgi:hypothetical protein
VDSVWIFDPFIPQELRDGAECVTKQKIQLTHYPSGMRRRSSQIGLLRMYNRRLLKSKGDAADSLPGKSLRCATSRMHRAMKAGKGADLSASGVVPQP